MPEESMNESGKRLARDMLRLRESRNITVDDLHDETKIPIGLIEAFEENALFDHPQFNRVYLRSFVRTYANVIGIESNLAIAALEDALGNRYRGALVAEYLGEQPESTVVDKRRPERAAPARGEHATQRPTDDLEHAESQKSDARVSGTIAPDRGRTERRRETSERLPASEQEHTRYPEAEQEEVQAEEDADEWTMQSPPRPTPSSTLRSRTPADRTAASRHRVSARGNGTGGRWILAVVAIALLAAVIWAVIRVTGGGETPDAQQTGTTDTAIAEETAAQETEEEIEEPIPMPELGDTLNVFVVAENDKLDPIRVTVDDDLRRPYWLELGDSMQFRPTDRIVVEEQLEDIRLLVEGIDYPTSRLDEDGRIVITRDSIQTYFASNPTR